MEHRVAFGCIAGLFQFISIFSCINSRFLHNLVPLQAVRKPSHSQSYSRTSWVGCYQWIHKASHAQCCGLPAASTVRLVLSSCFSSTNFFLSRQPILFHTSKNSIGLSSFPLPDFLLLVEFSTWGNVRVLLQISVPARYSICLPS